MNFNIQIQIIIKFGIAKSLNTYIKAQNSQTQSLNLRYVFIDFASTN